MIIAGGGRGAPLPNRASSRTLRVSAVVRRGSGGIRARGRLLPVFSSVCSSGFLMYTVIRFCAARPRRTGRSGCTSCREINPGGDGTMKKKRAENWVCLSGLLAGFFISCM
jgi:hypothetical protein